MMPEERKTSEPEYSPTRDRQFSELPRADRWRLVKEALNDLYPSVHRYWLYKWLQPYAVVSCSMLIVAALVGFKVMPFSPSFKLWAVCHTLLIGALLLAAWVFDFKSKNYVWEMSQILGEIEVKTLESKQHE